MKLLKAIILTMRTGPDKVSIETDLPDSVYPYTGHLELNFNCARQTAEAYMLKHFPDVPVERI